MTIHFVAMTAATTTTKTEIQYIKQALMMSQLHRMLN
jgi:hypothetical protein